MANRETLQQELKERAGQYARVFSTPEGKKVLEDLAAQYNHSTLASTDPHDTYRKIGEFNVIRRIQTMLEINDANKK